MPKFRKKPVIVEAEQWFPGKHVDGVGTVRFKTDDGQEHVSAWIFTLEGRMEVSPGDWIITGVRGEKYPCKPDIFEATYEPADLPPTDSSAAKAEVARLRAALVEIQQFLNENRENDGAFQSWNHMQAWKVATQALSTTTEPKQDKTCVICGKREGKYLSTANRWFCEPCTDALPPVNANAAKVERVREGDGNDV